MKGKLISALLVFALLLVFPVNIIAAADPTSVKYTVTADLTTIYEKASTSSTALVTAKKDYTFTAIGTTKSFIKLQFKKKNDDTVYEGFILKADTNYEVVQITLTTPEEPTLPIAPPESRSEDNSNTTGTVYWTPVGKSYHSNRGCRSLARSTTIRSGTKQEAANAGKTDPCNNCIR